MPVIDCEAYSIPAMELGAMHLLAEEIRLAGRDPDQTPVCFVNIYFGVNHLRTQSGLPWFVCIPRSFGFVTVLFHFVRHGDVVISTVDEITESTGLCVTLLWTTSGQLVEELQECLDVADRIVKQIEMKIGLSVPLPLRTLQLPDRFAVRTLDPRATAESSLSILVPDETHGVIVDEQILHAVGVFTGALGPLDEVLKTPLARALHLSATWQQHAIRGLGIEDWSNAIVASNTWIETFLVQLAVIANEAAGTPLVNLQESIYRGGGLPRFINTHLGQKYLKGKWDHTDSRSEFGGWFEHCYQLRNMVVHSGHIANGTEARRAYESAHTLAHFTTERAASVRDDRLRELFSQLREMHMLRKRRSRGAQRVD